MLRAKAFRAIRRIVADYPDKRFIYLTLTVKNCEMKQLGDTLTWMNESWHRLVKRKDFSAIGWMRSVEVTKVYDVYYDGEYLGRHGQTWIDKWLSTHKKGSRSFDESKLRVDLTNDVHPHFHALLMVNSNYFTKGYIAQKQWRKLWAESLRVDYDPRVDIQVVKSHKQSKAVAAEPEGDGSQAEIQPMDEELVKAIRYTLKYSTKPEEFLVPDTNTLEVKPEYQNWLLGITQQLHKRHSIALGGIFRKYLSEDDPKNLIRDEGNLEPSETEENDPRVTYVWRDEVTRYLMSA
jgi:hypothetical protein